LFRYSGERDRLEWVEQDVWRLDFMKTWREEDIKTLLDIVADALSSSAKVMRLKCQIIR
jgi:IMP-specific 5'-nucleotidase